MGSSYLKKNLDMDHLTTFARLWPTFGGLSTFILWLFIWSSGGVCGVVCGAIVLFQLQNVNARPTLTIVLSLGCGALLAIATFLFVGMAVTSVAYSTLKKLETLELRLASIEQKTPPNLPVALTSQSISPTLSPSSVP